MQPTLFENGVAAGCQEFGLANRGAPTGLYEYGLKLIREGKIPDVRQGLNRPVSFALEVKRHGELVGIKDLRTTEEIPAKKKGAPPKIIKNKVDMLVPHHQKHSNGVSPHLGADNAEYLCGVTDKPKKGSGKDKAREKFEACGAKHEKVLSGVDSPLAEGIIAYFKTWDSSKFREHPAWLALDAEQQKCFMTSTYLTFKSAETGLLAMEDPAIKQAFMDNFDAELMDEEGTVACTCSITGEKNVPRADLHPPISKVVGAQGAGACYISYSGDSVHSTVNFMTNQRGANYPIGKRTSMIIMEALKYLMTDRRHYRLAPDDTYYIFWTMGEPADEVDVSAAASMALFGRQAYIYDTPEDEYIAHAVGSMLAGSENAESFEGLAKSSDVRFYLLALRGNAARLVELAFQCMTFGDLMERIRCHSDVTKVVDGRRDKAGTLRRFTIPDLLRALETKAVAEGKVKSVVATNMYDLMFSSIATNGKYPDMFGRLLLERLSFDHWLTAERMGLLRGFLSLNSKDEKIREAASTPWLNENTDCPPYVLGRIFHTMLVIQNKASNNPKSNVETDHLSSMIHRPAMIFPKLLTETKARLRCLKSDRTTRKLAYRLEWELAELLNRLGHPLNLGNQTSVEQKLAFCLGYMMAKNFFYLPRNVKEELSVKQGDKQDRPAVLNTESNNPAYLSGRLFYVCESLQEAALPNVLSTIDRQYMAAAVNRAELTMPTVLNKAQAHVKKLTKVSSDKKALGYWYLGLVNQMVNQMPHDENGALALPKGVTASPQGKLDFLLGYFNEEYSWRKSRLDKKGKDKEEKEEDIDASEGDDMEEEESGDETL